MESEAITQLSADLLAGRDRAAMGAKVVGAVGTMPLPELLVLLVDVILMANQDRDREQCLTIGGWSVHRFTRDQIVDDPAQVAARLPFDLRDFACGDVELLVR